jgi:hypothetical protein
MTSRHVPNTFTVVRSSVRCAISRTVPGSIPGGVTGFFIDIFLPTVPASSENEHQEHFLGVKAAGA